MSGGDAVDSQMPMKSNSPTPDPCPDAHLLERFLFGEAQQSESSVIEKHINHCDSCLSFLDSLSARRHTIEQFLQEVSPDDEFLSEPQLESLKARVDKIQLSQNSAWTLEERAESTEVIKRPPPKCIKDYEILQELGEGGMGIVYKAKHLRLHKIVAIKVLADRHVNKSERIRRFVYEMRVIGELSHPNIVEATDAGEIDGTYYLVMEFVDGKDVSKLVRNNGPLRQSDACRIALEVAAGLEYIHDTNRVHRDIKPSNVMVAVDGRVRILDLGLARLAESEFDDEFTSTGEVIGTLDYMSPEQAMDSHTVDIRSDIYSLGCTLYKMLAGVAPLDNPAFRTPLAKLDAHRSGKIARVEDLRPEVSVALGNIIHQMLARNPEDRFDSPSEVMEALAPFAEESDLKALSTTNRVDGESETVNHTAKTLASKPKRNFASWTMLARLSVPVLAMVLIVVASPYVWDLLFASAAAPVPIPVHPVDSYRRATVKPLLWEKASKASSWRVEDANMLSVQSERISILGVGETDDSVTFSVDIQQFPWSGRVGVFFGFSVEDGQGTYQSLEIHKVPNRGFRIARQERTFLTMKPQSQSANQLANVDIKAPKSICTLELELQNGQLKSVRCDGVELRELTKADPNSPFSAQGDFGVINASSTGQFFDMKIDDERLVLEQ